MVLKQIRFLFLTYMFIIFGRLVTMSLPVISTMVAPGAYPLPAIVWFHSAIFAVISPEIPRLSWAKIPSRPNPPFFFFFESQFILFLWRTICERLNVYVVEYVSSLSPSCSSSSSAWRNHSVVLERHWRSNKWCWTVDIVRVCRPVCLLSPFHPSFLSHAPQALSLPPSLWFFFHGGYLPECVL